MTKDAIVRIQDLRAIGYCLQSCRPWFTDHGLSWSDFLANGIPASKLRATGDGLVEAAIERAEAREAE